MVRRHGWQLPAHTLQVVAITVFFLLSVAFYAFLAPFLGSDRLEYAAIAVYTPIALSVFLLYIRCSAIDPADTGIFRSFVPKSFPTNSNLQFLPRATGETRWTNIDDSQKKQTFHHLLNACACLLCGWVYKDDSCRNDKSPSNQAMGDDGLFCTMCNAEVQNKSKHCRSCDKCVDGFDHHCRWLNNCVGKKNYRTFFLLMALGLMWLLIEGGIGIAVVVHCFVNRREIDTQIVEKLGNSFSRIPYIVIVVSCTVVALLASMPLAELFFFHIILIKKGITTYEYVVAMRSQSEAPTISANGDEQSLPSSPTGSTATGLSGASSLGLQYKGAWCTPPRIFMDHQQDEVIPHLGPGRVPSTVDPDNLANPNKMQKRPVRISAWKLAKLNPEEAMRAMEKARESSSILRPVGQRAAPDAGYSSPGTVSSSRSSLSKDFLQNKEMKIESVQSPLKNSYPPSRASKDDNDSSTHSLRSYNSPSNMNEASRLSPVPPEQASKLSPLPPEQRFGLTRPVQPSSSWRHNEQFPLGQNTRHSLPLYNAGVSRSYCSTQTFSRSTYQASSSDYNSSQLANSGAALGQLYSNQLHKNARECGRLSVFWDQEAGRYISFPVNSRNENEARIAFPSQAHDTSSSSLTMQNNSVQIKSDRRSSPQTLPQSNHFPTLQVPPPEAGQRTVNSSSIQTHGNLLCSGESIFFGGPLSVPVTENSRTASSQHVVNTPRITTDLQNQGSQEIRSLHSPTPTQSPSNLQQVSPEIRPYRGLTPSSQSPVFAPKCQYSTIFPFSPQ
eukprot:TRINITY_DN24693_c1_g1_i1.p1 TRINITY_DN24693_c1_g1~~TRINITY_DN24693_c1_g1_i1.p1  ORF type:complete len:783 (-),score=122.63 TRINITY_DN24693_c1_g1_i1:140-2488(-)